MTTRTIPAILLLCMTFSCKKSETHLTNMGVITTIDARGCPCVLPCPCACGGYVFHFTDMKDTSRTIIDNNSIIQLPSGTKFPVYITLDWQNTTRCGVNSIKILSYKLQ